MEHSNAHPWRLVRLVALVTTLASCAPSAPQPAPPPAPAPHGGAASASSAPSSGQEASTVPEASAPEPQPSRVLEVADAGADRGDRSRSPPACLDAMAAMGKVRCSSTSGCSKEAERRLRGLCPGVDIQASCNVRGPPVRGGGVESFCHVSDKGCGDGPPYFIDERGQRHYKPECL